MDESEVLRVAFMDYAKIIKLGHGKGTRQTMTKLFLLRFIG